MADFLSPHAAADGHVDDDAAVLSGGADLPPYTRLLRSPMAASLSPTDSVPSLHVPLEPQRATAPVRSSFGSRLERLPPRCVRRPPRHGATPRCGALLVTALTLDSPLDLGRTRISRMAELKDRGRRR